MDARTTYELLEKLSPFKETPFDVIDDSEFIRWTGLKFGEHSVVWKRHDKDGDRSTYHWGVLLPGRVSKELGLNTMYSFGKYKEYAAFIKENLCSLHNVQHYA